jgi:MFS family permease
MPHPNESVCDAVGTRVGMDRRARAATTAIFFLTATTMAAWATRIPAIQERLDLSPGALALAILGLEFGAIVGLPTGGVLVTRLGSRSSLRIGFAVYPATLVAIALAPSLAALAAALCVMAVANSIVDVAMNAQGVEIERRAGRPLLSGMHAGHSFGLVASGLAGTAAAAADVPVLAHFGATAAVGVFAGLGATRWLVRERAPDGQPAFVRPSGPLMMIGVIAFCAFLLDGGAYQWSAVHLKIEHDAPPGLAAAAFTVFSLMLALGRLGGDRLVARWGCVRVVQGCGAVSAAGSALAIAAPSAALALAGWALFGLGLAALAPTVLGAAARVPGTATAVAIAAVTTVGYFGSFTGPPLIGAIAEVSGLSAALSLLVAVAGATALLARAGLSGARTAAGSAPTAPRRTASHP